MDAATLVSKVKSEGSFDVTDLQALGWINEVYADAVARSGWIEQVVSLGSTVANQSRYPLLDSWVAVKSVRVEIEGSAGRWGRFTVRASVQEMWDLQSGYANFSGRDSDGVFAEGFDATSTRYVELYPIPAGPGRNISAYVTVLPTDLVLTPTPTTPAIPADLHPMLIAGAVAVGLSRWSERDDLAAPKQATFEEKVKELTTRADSRVGGVDSSGREMIYGTGIVAKVKAEGNFDVPDSTVLGWVNDAYRDMVARAEWLREQVSLGPTVAGQAAYQLDERIVKIRTIQVGNVRYDLELNVDDIWDLHSGAQTFRQSSAGGGAFAGTYSSTGDRYVNLYPVPSVSGTTITGLVSMVPADLTLNPATQPALPADIVPGLIAGAVAIGLGRWQQRPDLAEAPKGEFEAKVDELRRRATSRVGGSGPQRMRIYGVDWR